ncbi:MAG TPA: 4Fe-4S dicluster domain-containing protein [Smithellaceae bacterium]|mgnify:CR=1 FL=1|nr:4Fe-4S dicluster domain-containing protein [Smithellaceae bacterium]HRS88427.1 4Fe-4S dicluster domain-containing protein [Smithellaceae bacterium]HRV25483.1 4Fe-4S dicluster domain-containing protein [Smithellaceae bacterium]
MKDIFDRGENRKKDFSEVPSDRERREFLKMGLVVTGVLAGGGILSLVSNVKKAYSLDAYRDEYPYKPHYAMVLRQDRCIDCGRCMEACVKTNSVPDYGWRTMILKRKNPRSVDQIMEFIPILCNQCNNPPCVRTCPTRATYKDKIHGIVMMDNKKCIGCKSCMMACPYNARYYNETRKAIDKCDFCFETKLSQGMNNVACAEACPADVRVFGDLSDPESRVFRMVHQLQKPVWVLRPELNAKPNIFYTKG